MGSHTHDIIVIGASLGGVEAFSRLVAALPEDLPAAVFIVQHVAAQSPGLFANVLNRRSVLPVQMAVEGESFCRGRIYVAPPDHHLLLRPETMWVVRGPRENHWRPAIDPLFRSAAVTFGPRVIGVVLTGLLDDGAAGLLAVSRCGGISVVQDPEDAMHPQMPRSAIAADHVQHSVSLDEMGPLLDRLSRLPAPKPPPIPPDILTEARIMENAMNHLSANDQFGPLTALVCPECGGSLRQNEDPSLPRYRCHVGHAYSEKALLDSQQESVEQSLWAALRSLRDRANLLHKMAKHARDNGRQQMAADYQQQSDETLAHAEVLRNLLQQSVEAPEADAQTEDADQDPSR